MNKSYKKLTNLIICILLLSIMNHSFAMTKENKQVQNNASFWERNKKKILITAGIVATIAIAGGATWYLSRKNKSQTQPSNPVPKANLTEGEIKKQLSDITESILGYRYDITMSSMILEDIAKNENTLRNSLGDKGYNEKVVPLIEGLKKLVPSSEKPQATQPVEQVKQHEVDLAAKGMAQVLVNSYNKNRRSNPNLQVTQDKMTKEELLKLTEEEINNYKNALSQNPNLSTSIDELMKIKNTVEKSTLNEFNLEPLKDDIVKEYVQVFIGLYNKNRKNFPDLKITKEKMTKAEILELAGSEINSYKTQSPHLLDTINALEAVKNIVERSELNEFETR